jgi:hypothetical protein
MFKTMLVLESPWEDCSVESTSVWPFVSEFARVREIKAFRQSFSDVKSFKHWVNCFHKEKLRGPKLLYIAAHGTDGRISALKASINGKTIAATIKRAKSIEYVHFGSCLFGTNKNLTALLKNAKHLKWAAGYESSVDWVDSTLLDILLWGRIESRDDGSKGKRTHTLAAELLCEVGGLAKALGFRFQYRYGNKIKSLISPQ